MEAKEVWPFISNFRLVSELTGLKPDRLAAAISIPISCKMSGSVVLKAE